VELWGRGAVRDVIWGGQEAGGHLLPLNLKNSDFLVFLSTKFGIFHILPPPFEVGQNFAPLEKTKMTPLEGPG